MSQVSEIKRVIIVDPNSLKGITTIMAKEKSKPDLKQELKFGTILKENGTNLVSFTSTEKEN